MPLRLTKQKLFPKAKVVGSTSSSAHNKGTPKHAIQGSTDPPKSNLKWFKWVE